MDGFAIAAYIVAGVQLLGIGYFAFYRNYIRPFLSYKLVVYDIDDEFKFIVKKKKAIVVNDMKGFNLFKGKEFYVIPLVQEMDKKLSKRDDQGMVSYYYWRNVSTPLELTNKDKIRMSQDASLLSKVTDTKILDSSLLLTKQAFKLKLWHVAVMAIVIILIIFNQDILGALGLAV